MKKLCVGIIGSGMVADQHIENINIDGRGFVKWVNARSKATVERKMDRFQVPFGTINYREVLEDLEVEAVIIATPPDTHVDILFDCLDAGKHVLLEKPMCIKKEDIPRILNKVKRHPNQVVLECSARYTLLNPKFKYLRQIIEEGKLGEIYYIHQSTVWQQKRPGIEYNPGAYWFLDKSKAGGGPLFDWGEYDLAFHLGLFDKEPTMIDYKVFKINGIDNVDYGGPVFDVEEHAVALMEFSNGLKYYYEVAMNAHNQVEPTTRIYGTKGGVTLCYHPWEADKLTYYFVDQDGKGKACKEEIDLALNNQPSQEYELIKHFFDCILDKAEPAMPVELAASHLEIIFKLSDSETRYFKES